MSAFQIILRAVLMLVYLLIIFLGVGYVIVDGLLV